MTFLVSVLTETTARLVVGASSLTALDVFFTSLTKPVPTWKDLAFYIIDLPIS